MKYDYCFLALLVHAAWVPMALAQPGIETHTGGDINGPARRARIAAHEDQVISKRAHEQDMTFSLNEARRAEMGTPKQEPGKNGAVTYRWENFVNGFPRNSVFTLPAMGVGVLADLNMVNCSLSVELPAMRNDFPAGPFLVTKIEITAHKLILSFTNNARDGRIVCASAREHVFRLGTLRKAFGSFLDFPPLRVPRFGRR